MSKISEVSDSKLEESKKKEIVLSPQKLPQLTPLNLKGGFDDSSFITEMSIDSLDIRFSSRNISIDEEKID